MAVQIAGLLPAVCATSRQVAPVPVERPLLRYFGGKWRIGSWVIAQFPAHRIYVEPFGGGASVLLQKPPSVSEVYNDLDGDIVNLFRVLRDSVQCADLRRRLELTPFARAEFEAAYQSSPEPVEQARRLMIRSWMGIGCGSHNKTGFRSNVTSSNNPSVAGVWKKVVDHLPVIVERLRAVTLENRPAVEVIQGHDSPSTLFYVDPPYPLSTRPGSGKRYAHEMSDDEHRRLAEVLRSVQGKVVISGYPCALYDQELYPDWTRREHHASTNGSSSGRTEVVWLSPNAAQVPAMSDLPLFAVAAV